MTVIEFPGELMKSEQFGTMWVPTATVEIKYQKLSLSCEMLVDAGAYLSMIPYQVGIELGLTISNDEVLEAGGAGGASIPHVVKEVELQIGAYSIQARIGWALTDEIPLLLGRLDVFDEFDIEFSQSRHKIIFLTIFGIRLAKVRCYDETTNSREQKEKICVNLWLK